MGGAFDELYYGQFVNMIYVLQKDLYEVTQYYNCILGYIYYVCVSMGCIVLRLINLCMEYIACGCQGWIYNSGIFMIYCIKFIKDMVIYINVVLVLVWDVLCYIE